MSQRSGHCVMFIQFLTQRKNNTAGRLWNIAENSTQQSLTNYEVADYLNESCCKWKTNIRWRFRIRQVRDCCQYKRRCSYLDLSWSRMIHIYVRWLFHDSLSLSIGIMDEPHQRIKRGDMKLKHLPTIAGYCLRSTPTRTETIHTKHKCPQMPALTFLLW
jgi:hypothetical protein